MPNNCANCGQPLAENVNFCPNCGAKTTPARPAPSATSTVMMGRPVVPAAAPQQAPAQPAPAQPAAKQPSLEPWKPQPQKPAPEPMRQSMAPRQPIPQQAPQHTPQQAPQSNATQLAPQRSATVAYGTPAPAAKPMPAPRAEETKPMNQPIPQNQTMPMPMSHAAAPMDQPKPMGNPMPQNGNGLVHLRVTWPGCWMLFAPKMKLFVDKIPAGAFPFTKPFDIQLDVPAKCVLTVNYKSMFGPRRIAINAAPGQSITCKLNYSRWLGWVFATILK